ncbi:hypothetical protein F5Y19DRAFT_423990 [Xylariaceae sp. FL1651]|nr:hypothetical protein F5Y19DRAFT_423990 [Xylariaceae sp. FL1651]
MSLNIGSRSSNQLARIVPDLTKLIPYGPGNMTMSPHNSDGCTRNAAGPYSASPTNAEEAAALNYEDSDLNAITRSQMNQDLIAYRYDLEFCQTQLSMQPDLTPQEVRTLQIRVLDCGHNIRHCKHRIQMLDAQARLGIAPYSTGAIGGSGTGSGSGPGSATYRSGGTAAAVGKHKRQRVRKSEGGEADVVADRDGDSMIVAAGGEPDAEGANDSIVAVGTDADTTASPGPSTHTLQRLGYWDCRLCQTRKYLEAGPNRVPSAPCKWPLKDISKMINHFLDLHTEHTPKERCSELGDALAQNRGPFEYWLTRTKAQDLESLQTIDQYIQTLQEGSLPEPMRSLLRAAAAFPNTVSNSYKK